MSMATMFRLPEACSEVISPCPTSPPAPVIRIAEFRRLPLSVALPVEVMVVVVGKFAEVLNRLPFETAAPGCAREPETVETDGVVIRCWILGWFLLRECGIVVEAAAG
jgi:hypothetical protein